MVLLSFVDLRGIEGLVQTLVIPVELWLCVTCCRVGQHCRAVASVAETWHVL